MDGITWTLADLAKLKAAKASGASSVRTAEGKSVAFRSLAELDAIIADLEAEIAGSAAPRVRATRTSFRRGHR